LTFHGKTIKLTPVKYFPFTAGDEMKLANRIKLNSLFDLYGILLTEKQREFYAQHYLFDLSLGEIAENCQVSRQAVHDLLRRTIAQLKYYEESLHLLAKDDDRQKLLGELDAALEDRDYRWAREITEKLKNI
jgi:hypothetical protein